MGSEARRIGVESPRGRNGVPIFLSQLRHLIPFLPRSLGWPSTCTLCVLPDAGGRGAEGRAPESAGWDCGYIVGCPRARWLLLRCVEDGEAAATIAGPMRRQAAPHPSLEVGDSEEGAAISKSHFFPWGDLSRPSLDPTPQFYAVPRLPPRFQEAGGGYRFQSRTL